MRLIDADILMKDNGLESATKYGNRSEKQRTASYSTMMLYEIAEMIDEAPTIDAEPVKHGEWVDVKFSEGVFKDSDDSDDIGLSITSAKCSLCQRYSEQLQQYRPQMPAYCSHCGAKMDLKDGESDG